jgi:hypothetical protein
MQEDPIRIRPLDDSDRAQVVRFIDEKWGADLGRARHRVPPGAVAHSWQHSPRKVKAEIPETGDHGIPLRDELDLVRTV